jgi:hypothetical protein
MLDITSDSDDDFNSGGGSLIGGEIRSKERLGEHNRRQ